jgi:hypothetical protein
MPSFSDPWVMTPNASSRPLVPSIMVRVERKEAMMDEEPVVRRRVPGSWDRPGRRKDG